MVAVGDYLPGDVETRFPVQVSGGVADVRAISLVLCRTVRKTLGAENGSVLQSYSSPVPVLSRHWEQGVYRPCSHGSGPTRAWQSEGEVVVLRFEGRAHVGISKAEFRSSLNTSLQVTIKDPVRDLPTSFALVAELSEPIQPDNDD